MAIVALNGKSVGGEAPVEGSLRVPSAKIGTRSVPATLRTWQAELRCAIRSPAQLIEAIELPASLVQRAEWAAQSFPVFAPWPYIARMEKGNPADPLLRQVLPLDDELRHPPGFASDPVGDSEAVLSPGVLQKYHGRVLLVT